jgi:hypothetical protein
MNRSHRRLFVTMVAAVGVMVPAGLAWACVGLISLTTGSSTVPPGGTVTVIGREFAQGAPVDIHLDSPTGPILATAPPPDTTMTSQWRVDVPIPADIKPGPHVLVATQQYHNMNAGAPARAIIHVGTSPPAVGQAATTPRPSQVLVSSGPSAVTLLLIGVGAAAGALLLAGLWYVAAARRPEPVTEPVRTA